MGVCCVAFFSSDKCDYLIDRLWGAEQEQEMFILYLYEMKSCLLRSFSLCFTLARELRGIRGANW